MSLKWPKRMRDGRRPFIAIIFNASSSVESDEEVEEADEDERPLKRIKLGSVLSVLSAI